MKANIIYIILLSILLLSSCRRDDFEPDISKASVSFLLSTENAMEYKTRSNAYENDLRDIYLLVFNVSDNLFVECKPAIHVSDNKYTANLEARANPVRIIAVANIASLIKEKQAAWVSETTSYQSISEDLLTHSLDMQNGHIIAMPELPPMSGSQQLEKIEKSMSIGNPFVMVRATAKICISSTASNFTFLGANMYQAPSKGYVLPGQSSVHLSAIAQANYAGADHSGNYSSQSMISQASPIDPLYCYETGLQDDFSKDPFLIIHSNRGYYRINLVDKQGKQLSLQRNYYYKINISKVLNNGANTPEEAILNPPLVPDIEVNDPNSHEIISDGIDYLGLSNSKYILYVSSIINEFNSDAFQVQQGANYNDFNGFSASTLTYKSRSSAQISCTECVTESGGQQSSGIKFREGNVDVWKILADSYDDMLKWGSVKEELILPPSPHIAKRQIINIVIPHDFIRGKLKVKVGNLEKEIIIERNQIIPFLGEVINMGTGYSTATIDFEKSYMPGKMYTSSPPYSFPSLHIFGNRNLISFSASKNTAYSKSLEFLNPSDSLYVKVEPVCDAKQIFVPFQTYNTAASEFYLSSDKDQSRTKVHLIREPFNDGIKDAHVVGSPIDNYVTAFWKNLEKGERIIRVPQVTMTSYWTARVIYGKEFIRLNYTDDSRTTGFGSDGTSGNAEDYYADDTWTTYLEQLNPAVSANAMDRMSMLYPKFRISLSGVNPDPSKPRYGLVAFMFPYVSSFSVGQTFFIFVRQGEEADYIYSTSDTYNGVQRSYAQAFSPYNLTVANVLDHLGGADYADHKSMNGAGVFTQYPSQVGYLYRFGDDRAFHPSNPATNTAITNYTYDYNQTYQEVCPPGYTLAKADDNNSVFNHSFAHSTDEYYRNGLCADGYYDRQAVNLHGQGGELGNYGSIYFNTKTLASIFFPSTNTRVESGKAMSWAKFDSWAGDSQMEGHLGLVKDSLYTNRSRLLPVRCVKK